MNSKRPAFIPYLYYRGVHKSAEDTAGDCPACRFVNDVPDDYLWQQATDSTPAGWVRPREHTREYAARGAENDAA